MTIISSTKWAKLKSKKGVNMRILGLLLVLKVLLFSCGGGYYDPDTDYIFLKKRDRPYLSPYLISIDNNDEYNTLYYDYEDNAQKANLLSWQKSYFKDLNLTQIKKIVYGGEGLEKIKDNDIKNYLLFAKNQEKYVTKWGYYSGDVNFTRLQNDALSNIEKVHSKWLKLRYFYLGLRLSHYKGKGTLKIYHKYSYLLKNSQQKVLKDWIQAIYAGALIRSKQVAKGVYEFTKLFDQNAINWYLVYYNFKYIHTNEEWSELLSYAKNDEKKCQFYALRSLSDKANKLDELKAIYKIDPNSKWFDFVLYRILVGTQPYFDNNGIKPQKRLKMSSLVKFLKSIKRDDLYLRNLTLGYSYLYAKDFQKAKMYAKMARKSGKFADEVGVLDYLIYLSEIDRIDANKENEIANQLQNITLNKNDVQRYTLFKIKKIYEKSSDKTLQVVAKNYPYFDFRDMTLEDFERLKKFTQKKDKTKLQELMQKDLTTNLDEKNHIKFLMKNFEFKKALSINDEFLDFAYDFDPFSSMISGTNRHKKRYLAIKQIAQKALNIQENLQKDPSSPTENYLMANLLYNMGRFGNARKIFTPYLEMTYTYDPKAERKKLKYSTRYYKIALENTTNRNFKAKIIYALSKNKIALQWLDWGECIGANCPNELRYNYGVYFDKLQNEYQDTAYYKELISECGNFKAYVNGH